MQKTTIYFTTEQKRSLERVSRATGRSEAELIRQAVAAVTASYRVQEPTLPLFASREPDLAARLDELLDGFGSG